MVEFRACPEHFIPIEFLSPLPFFPIKPLQIPTVFHSPVKDGTVIRGKEEKMGNTSSMLTQYDIEEVQEHCNHTFTQQEIVSLYQRFCQLDRNGGGFISADEFLSVPEFAVNPLSQRLLRMLDGLNFKEFVAFLSAFSSHASLQQKIELIFKVYDSDCNGKVTFNDVLDVLRDLTGSFISEQQRQQVLTHVLEEAGYTKDSLLVLADFMKNLESSGLKSLKMEVEVPVD
ncbi:uncharacterized protein LOC131217047 [Magnolia sinica]|uniref:uncharacterized protein LOC131217047 n=1 Tax=Magnolia sinica TaxID=86752 RepID=UPI002657C3DF|nr:uncharacterized protein LOC131217047 [Magnolia sinica]XP_058067730.1 uncharacterized protein LOC131217047 [Magnolia sinica]XP_058067731.1 uncharacterized protein LOC131217047 [Magnolia sinica]